MRSLRTSIFALKNQNLWLWGAASLSLILTSIVVLIQPIAGIFGMVAIGFNEYIVSVALGFIIIPLVELVKIFTKSK